MSTSRFIMNISGSNLTITASLTLIASLWRIHLLFCSKNRWSSISFSDLIKLSPVKRISSDTSLTESLETSCTWILWIGSHWVVILLWWWVTTEEIWYVVYVHVFLDSCHFTCNRLWRWNLLILLITFETIASWLGLWVALFFGSGIHYETVIIYVNIWCRINIQYCLWVWISRATWRQWISIIK